MTPLSNPRVSTCLPPHDKLVSGMYAYMYISDVCGLRLESVWGTFECVDCAIDSKGPCIHTPRLKRKRAPIVSQLQWPRAGNLFETTFTTSKNMLHLNEEHGASCVMWVMGCWQAGVLLCVQHVECQQASQWPPCNLPISSGETASSQADMLPFTFAATREHYASM